MTKALILCSALLLLAGCASHPVRMGSTGHIRPGAMSHVNVGMTKQEVIDLFGLPETVAATAHEQTLVYVEERPWWEWVKVNIVIVDGKVASYGEAPRKRLFEPTVANATLP